MTEGKPPRQSSNVLLAPGGILSKVDNLFTNTYVDDELHDAMNKHRNVQSLVSVLTYSLFVVFGFALLFFIIAIIDLISDFKAKTYSCVTGFVSILHLVGCPMALAGLRRQHRNLVFIYGIFNFVWLLMVVNNLFLWTFACEY